ncbi:hypothetical protein E2C01_043944 [Portunus trituberculatus]|uniref:Uncharacterized protein n=1 Tax=Portunus trituberculatus TaxID=210409 RepID=A0A5B7FU92_PORTR|nr:hypothetical protein [Portunus trituberculatus]
MLGRAYYGGKYKQMCTQPAPLENQPPPSLYPVKVIAYALETYVGIEIVKTVAINLLTSIDPP